MEQSSNRPFFDRVNDIHLLAYYKVFRSKYLKLKEKHDHMQANRIFQRINSGNLTVNGAKDEEVLIKVQTIDNEQKMYILFNYDFPIDKNNGLSIISKDLEIPIIKIYVQRPAGLNIKSKQRVEGPLYAELILCEYLQDGNGNFFYKAIMEGLTGTTKIQVGEEEYLSFPSIKSTKYSRQNMVFHLFMALYREDPIKNVKYYKDLYYSRSLFIAQDPSIHLLDNKDTMMRYISEFGIENLSPSKRVRYFQNVEEQASTLEMYFIKRSAKQMNLLYLAFKFFNTCQVYFKKMDENVQLPQFKPTSEFQEQISQEKLRYFRWIAHLMMTTKQAILSIDDSHLQECKLLCNHLDPNATIVFRIIYPFTRARFIVSQQYSKHICIINGDKFDLSSFTKLHPSNIKVVYRIYLTIIRATNRFKQVKNQPQLPYHGDTESEQDDEAEYNEDKSQSQQEVARSNKEKSSEIVRLQRKKPQRNDMKLLLNQSKKQKLQMKKQEKEKDFTITKTKDIITHNSFIERQQQIVSHEAKHRQRNLQIQKAIHYCYHSRNQVQTNTFEMGNSLTVISNKKRSQPQPLRFLDYDEPPCRDHHHYPSRWQQHHHCMEPPYRPSSSRYMRENRYREYPKQHSSQQPRLKERSYSKQDPDFYFQDQDKRLEYEYSRPRSIFDRKMRRQ